MLVWLREVSSLRLAYTQFDVNSSVDFIFSTKAISSKIGSFFSIWGFHISDRHLSSLFANLVNRSKPKYHFYLISRHGQNSTFTRKL